MKYVGPQKTFKIIGINTLLQSFLSICANAKEYSFNYKQLDVGFPAQSRDVWFLVIGLKIMRVLNVSDGFNINFLAYTDLTF